MKILLICVLVILSFGVQAQDLKNIGVTFNGKSELIYPLESEKWQTVKCTYEYKNKADLISNGLLVIGKKENVRSGFAVTCNSKKEVSIVSHTNWTEYTASGNIGDKKFIENELAVVDLANTTLQITKDNFIVTYKIKFKKNFIGNFSVNMYVDATDAKFVNITYMSSVQIGDTRLIDGRYIRKMPKEWANSLKPKGGKTLKIANDKKTNYIIVLSNNPTSQEEKAAYEIKSYFELISGAPFKIVKENNRPASAKFISIGKTNLLKKSSSKYKNSDLSKEGYVVDVINNNIYIYGGTTRGVINGAYSLLEEDLGCRFYSSDVEYVPEMKNFIVSIAPRKFLPVLDLRDSYIYESFNPEWSLKNKTNSPEAIISPAFGGSIRYFNQVHTYALYFPPEKYFADHPEYYALVNGVRTTSQLCNTNPDVIRLSIEKTKEIFRNNPNVTITAISPNDGMGFCDCENCKKLDAENGGRSGSYYYLVSKVAEGIKDEFPDKKIITLAYLDYANPPTNIKIPENVLVQLYTDSHAWKYQFCFVTESDEFQSYMKKWAKVGANIFIWDYVTDYIHPLVPMANMPVVRENMKFYIKNNAKGILLQGACYPATDMSDMRAWVWAKQFWNIDLDTKTLMKDFVYGYYQESAEPMWEYYILFWNYWEKYHKLPHKCGEKSDNPLLNNLMCSYAPDGPMFTKEFMADMANSIVKAEKAAKTEDVLWRVKKIKASLLYLEMSQHLGYFTEFRDFVVGSDFKGGKLENREKNQANYDELKILIKHFNITSLSGITDIDTILKRWDSLFAATGESIPKVSLPNEWYFVPDKEDKGVSEKWFDKSLYFEKAKREAGFGGADATTGIDKDGNARLRTDINKGWEVYYPNLTGYGWYFQNFKITSDIKDFKHYYLYFAGVDEEAWVYVNGKLVTEHSVNSTGRARYTLWNEPFFVDIKDFVNLDSENKVAVRVFNFAQMGGIWKPVTLFGSDKELTVANFELDN